jgi:hypothetical protein
MKLTERDLINLVKNVIKESSGVELYPEGWKEMDGIFMNPESIERMKQWVKDNPVEGILDENTFEIDPDDNGMQQKIAKLKGDTTLYNDDEDEIVIANEGKKIGGTDDYLKAIKKADRELDYELNGPGWKANDKPHKNKAKYDRRRDKNFQVDDIAESVYTKADVIKLMLEKKYDGKAYSKKDFINLLNDGTCKEDEQVTEGGDNNPWAICSANIDKKEEPAKHERCVKAVKKQNK